MKSLAIAVILAATSISSVSSAFCMQKYLSRQGLEATPSTNAMYMKSNSNQTASVTTTAGNEQVNRQR